MIVVRELGSRKAAFLVSTGNGNIEFDVMSAIAKKHNGRGVLWFPKTLTEKLEIRDRRRATRGKVKGRSVYNIVNIYPGKYGITSFIFLMDAEHIESAEDVVNYFRKELKVRVEDFRIFERGAFLIKGLVGSHRVRVYTAVLGEIKCIEEDIARLVEIELGIPIDVERTRSRFGEGREFKKFLRKTIMKVLREHDMRVKDLIDRASIRSLESAFPSLSKIFKIVENESLDV